MQKIVVLTYNVAHRKTYDVLCRLKVFGYDNVTVCAFPFHYKKTFTPLIKHRPEENGIPTKKVCDSFNYQYKENMDKIPVFEKGTKILICGAGIIPQEVVEKNIIINSHPGYIPDVRGLDALKWAIIEDKPIGCTTHLLGKEIDAGLIIERKAVPIYQGDTFHAVAMRVYEQEVSMLVEAIEKVENANEYISGGDNIVHKRMPHDIEKNLLQKFEIRKNKERDKLYSWNL